MKNEISFTHHCSSDVEAAPSQILSVILDLHVENQTPQGPHSATIVSLKADRSSVQKHSVMLCGRQTKDMLS